MGIEYYALNHERKEAFELGRRCYDDLLKLKTVEEYRKLMWDRLDPSGCTRWPTDCSRSFPMIYGRT
jgi:hypothetical protein